MEKSKPVFEKSPYYGDEQNISVLELTTVLNDTLRSHGYSRDTIKDIAINSFLSNEAKQIGEPTNIHLLALKKSLLYALPVIAPIGSNQGIQLTSQVKSPAIQYDMKYNKANYMFVNNQDKYRFIGFAFQKNIINHLSHDIYPLKFISHLPIDYEDSPITLEHIEGIEKKKTTCGDIFLVDPKHYEDVGIYNKVNKLIANKLTQSISAILACVELKDPVQPIQINPIVPFNKLPYIDILNQILPIQIDKTFTSSYFECLKLSANWLLYDLIELIGFDSKEVNEKLKYLAYVKDQNSKVRLNIKATTYKALLSTRAEKITRERYPYFFDYTDRRVIFVKFNRFSIEKLPTRERQEVKTLLEKELATQEALLNNDCEHISRLKDLRNGLSVDTYKSIEPYINFDSLDSDHMYSCKLCNQPILCAHQVDLYEGMATIDNNSGLDQEYLVRQKVVNQYKLIDKSRTGLDGTEISFTYFCKYCGEEIGKSEDSIRSTIKTSSESNDSSDNMNESIIYSSIASVVKSYMNHNIVPISGKTIIRMILDDIKHEITRRLSIATKMERDNSDKYIRLMSTIFTLTALISLNINQIKSNESILALRQKDFETRDVEPVSGGASLKEELLVAFKIMQNGQLSKSLGFNDDKIKSMLIEAFKFTNKIFSDEVIHMKALTPQDRLLISIKSSPLSSYAKYMYQRETKDKSINDKELLDIMGIDTNKFYGKAKSKIESHALLKNIYTPKRKESSDMGKYKYDSYTQLIKLLSIEPINDQYLSTITDDLTDFVKSFQHKHSEKLKLKRTVPVWFLPVVNNREYDFNLKNYHIGYCLENDKLIKPHRWQMSKQNNKLTYSCKYCNLIIDNAKPSNNETIESKLEERMLIQAFFELYSVSCPVKDAHVFDSNVCTHCGVSKADLSSMDMKYYKKHLATYMKRRTNITTELLKEAKEIIEYAQPVDKIKKDQESKKPDLIKLESLSNSLSKIFKADFSSVGMNSNGEKSTQIVESYIRLFYSHYLFAKNISIEAKNHPDPHFFKFLKETFFNGVSLKSVSLPPLDSLNSQSSDPNILLTHLYETIHEVMKSGVNEAVSLVQFIVDKIIQQDNRRKQFNFAKLKTINTSEGSEMKDENIEIVEEEDEEFDMFDGYDISYEDMEDNIDGDVD